jgi:hypothetical protein
MDARVRTGTDVYDSPAGECPPPGAAAPGGGSSTAGASTAGASSPRAGERPGYSESFGTVGTSDANGSDPDPKEAFKEVGLRLAELKEFAAYYVAAKIDGYKVTARNLGVYAALGIVGLIAGSAIISTAAVLLLVGLALAIGKPFDPDQPWVGAVVVGLLVLGGLAGGIIFFMKKLTATSRKKLVEKYENRQRDERIQFGEDVRGRRAGSAGREDPG